MWNIPTSKPEIARRQLQYKISLWQICNYFIVSMLALVLDVWVEPWSSSQLRSVTSPGQEASWKDHHWSNTQETICPTLPPQKRDATQEVFPPTIAMPLFTKPYYYSPIENDISSSRGHARRTTQNNTGLNINGIMYSVHSVTFLVSPLCMHNAMQNISKYTITSDQQISQL